MNLHVENPYTQLTLDALCAAKRAQASDIHFQPEEAGIDIRFRIHGSLIRWKLVPATHRISLLQEVKRLCNLKLSVSLRPQDARQSFPQFGLDVRANIVPTLHGEKVVLRLLERGRVFDLSNSGLSGGALHSLRGALGHRSGVCLITGPTGSGKTTTLYSALRELDAADLNIVTIEDPIEYSFPGITQTQVGERMSFAEALKAMLRQDPDVIIFGEIRDPESAELCFQAASTGHLVLSTLHANGAREAVGRLRDLGISEDRLLSTLRFSSAQRLLAKLCPRCKSAVSVNDVHEGCEGAFKRNPRGCDDCHQGLIGRIPILETLEIRKEWEHPFNPPGFRPLSALASELARTGEVDAFEALEVA